MRNINILAVIFLWALFLPKIVAAGSIDELDFLTENYPPFNYKAEGKVQGLAVDILLEMFNEANSSKSREDIKVLPWARGYKMAQEKKNVVLFVTVRTKARENLFKWVGPITYGVANQPSVLGLIAKKSKNIKINSPKEAERFTIGAVRNDAGETQILKAGVNPNSIYRTNSSKNTAKMLAADRIDLWSYGYEGAMWNLKKLGYNVDDYEVVYTLKKSAHYFAVQKDTDDELVNKLQAALDRTKAK